MSARTDPNMKELDRNADIQDAQAVDTRVAKELCRTGPKLSTSVCPESRILNKKNTIENQKSARKVPTSSEQSNQW